MRIIGFIDMGNYLIVGGSKGIGKSLVALLHQNGHQIWVAARQRCDLPSGVNFINWDALGNESLQPLTETLDGLAYLPGSVPLKPFHRITDAEWLMEFQLHVMGAVKVLRSCLPLLKTSPHASVVLFSTVAAQTGMPFHASIGAMKGAIESLTKSLAAEWAPVIRVNAIAPGLVDTGLTEKFLNASEKREAAAKRHPLGRVGIPEDVAQLASFLLSRESGWITGQVMAVDGGLGALKL